MKPENPSQPREVAVIGGGLAGLTAAIQLAHAGLKVVLLEKNQRAGGKLNTLQKEGFTWDTGPSLLTMPYVLREFFQSVGKRLEDYLELVPVEPCCRYWWPDGSTLDEDAGFWQRPEVQRFLEHAKGLYEISADLFLNPFAGLKEWLSPRNLRKLRHLPKIASLRSMHETVSRYFEDPRLVQLFDRYATYNGSSPYLTPSAFNIITYVEAEFGGWYVRGGMYRLAESLLELAAELGVEVRTGCEVTGLRKTAVGGYELRTGTGWESFAGVICNEDVLMASKQLLGSKMDLQKNALSTSGFILFLGVARKYDRLAHHNVFFSGDYRAEFDQMFGKLEPAKAPTIYVAASSRTEPGRAPEGCDNWFVLVNAPPAIGGFDWQAGAQSYGDRIIEMLEGFGFEGLR